MNGFIELLGEENVVELKKRLVDLIIEEVRSEFEVYGEYLLNPPDMQDTIQEAISETNEKVSKMYQKAIIDINKDYISKMQSYMKNQVSEAALRSKVMDYATKLKCNSEYSDEYRISQHLFKILEETEPVGCDS